MPGYSVSPASIQNAMSNRAPIVQLLAAFIAVYIIWGSTYLAIAFAIDSLPPFLMLAVRFLVAGGVMLAWTLMRKRQPITRRQIVNAMIIGAATLGIGTGAVAWAQQEISSGIAALLVTTVPLWMVFLDWRWFGSGRPRAQVLFGLILGIVGVGLLAAPDLNGSSKGWAMLGVVVGSASWSVGSMQSKRMDLPKNLGVSAAWQMMGGGILLLIAGFLTGEVGGLDVQAMTTSSLLGLAYLVVFGSIVGFTAYVWLLANAQPRQIASYAFVNPVVAVLLGWLLAGEVLNTRIGIAMLVLVSAVALIVYYGRTPRSPAKHAIECTPMPAAAVSAETPA